jgi:hypothetical protein
LKRWRHCGIGFTDAYHLFNFRNLPSGFLAVPSVSDMTAKRLISIKVELIPLYPKSPAISKNKTESFRGAQFGDGVWKVCHYLSRSPKIIDRNCHRDSIQASLDNIRQVSRCGRNEDSSGLRKRIL